MTVQDKKVHNGLQDENLEPDHVFYEAWKEAAAKMKKILGKSKESTNVLYLTRHGESLNNVYGRIGGNASLSSNGEEYAVKLANFFKNTDDLQIWHSELIRTKQTVADFDLAKRVVPQLNEINAGDHEDMTYEEIEAQFHDEFVMRDQDKLRYRYPKGESYVDVCKRLCQVLPEMTTKNNLLVVSHQAVLRCIYSFFMKEPMSKIPYVKIPLHTILEVTIHNEVEAEDGIFFATVKEIKMPINCVDTYRSKPKNCAKDRTYADAISSEHQDQD